MSTVVIKMIYESPTCIKSVLVLKLETFNKLLH